MKNIVMKYINKQKKKSTFCKCRNWRSHFGFFCRACTAY